MGMTVDCMHNSQQIEDQSTQDRLKMDSDTGIQALVGGVVLQQSLGIP